MKYLHHFTQRHECYPHEESTVFEKVTRTNFLLKWFSFKMLMESHNLQPECTLFTAEPRIYLPNGDKLFLGARIMPVYECMILFPLSLTSIPYPHYIRCAFRAIEGGDTLPDKDLPARTYGSYKERYKDFNPNTFRTINPFNHQEQT